MSKYGIFKAQTNLPPIDLIIVPHRGRDLIGAKFGPSTYNRNVGEMSKQHEHSDKFPRVSFRPATTEESIAFAAYQFGQIAKPKIFDPRLLQAGRIVRTQDGVFTNTSETNDATLKAMLNEVEKINGIYLIDNNMAFAPYESFKIGVQEGREFVEGGLARALEHTDERVAENLNEMASKGFYPRGVDVWGFEGTKTPLPRVVSLNSNRNLDNNRLNVNGNNWNDNNNGYAFGMVLISKTNNMKSYNNIYSRITSKENILLAYNKARKGKSNRRLL